MPVEIKLETVKFEPCRFVGGSVYLGNKGRWDNNSLTEILWERSGWIFEMLDGLSGYATVDTHKAALTVWDKFDGKNELFGYYIGKFMKAGTPVPHDLDYFDIDMDYMMKIWVKGKFRDGGYGDLWNCPGYEADQKYIDMSRVCAAEVYPEPDGNGESFVGYYRPCNLKR